MDDTNKIKRYKKLTDADRTRMIGDREEQLAELAGCMGSYGVDQERAELNRDLERLRNKARKVVWDEFDQLVRYVKAK